ncbi:MAG: helix-turn-helix transcriptional regulator [Leptolyngbya sp. SIO1D8]|nr:helix-turn-helix transcriptional regulator [Leptolyngbya sp. SIO1D8]
MEPKDVFKVLANETRLQILQWLKHPTVYFPQDGVESCEHGVCVGLIKKKSGLAQSTISHYLAMLEEAGLVTAARHGQWTHYRRNEKTLEALSNFIRNDL